MALIICFSSRTKNCYLNEKIRKLRFKSFCKSDSYQKASWLVSGNNWVCHWRGNLDNWWWDSDVLWWWLGLFGWPVVSDTKPFFHCFLQICYFCFVCECLRLYYFWSDVTFNNYFKWISRIGFSIGGIWKGITIDTLWIRFLLNPRKAGILPDQPYPMKELKGTFLMEKILFLNLLILIRKKKLPFNSLWTMPVPAVRKIYRLKEIRNMKRRFAKERKKHSVQND